MLVRRGRDAMLSVTRALNRLVPEAPWKNRARAALLSLRSGLPKELMVGPGERVIQVGMWQPDRLLRLARCVGPSGRVIVVEASASVAGTLQGHLHAHGVGNVELVQKGAWEERGVRDLRLGMHPDRHQLTVDNVAMPRQSAGDDRWLGSERIEVDTVDNIVRALGIDHVDYLEITVNGVEMNVLKGMPETLGRVERAFVAGMMREESSREPLNRPVAAFLEAAGFRTKITRSRPAPNPEWGTIDGHVFAWRER